MLGTDAETHSSQVCAIRNTYELSVLVCLLRAGLVWATVGWVAVQVSSVEGSREPVVAQHAQCGKVKQVVTIKI